MGWQDRNAAEHERAVKKLKAVGLLYKERRKVIIAELEPLVLEIFRRTRSIETIMCVLQRGGSGVSAGC